MDWTFVACFFDSVYAHKRNKYKKQVQTMWMNLKSFIPPIIRSQYEIQQRFGKKIFSKEW